jgi:predicted anti-sigma-YlaC factor YlaD
VELYFYGELDARADSRFEEHLRGCDACRAAMADLEVIRRALAARRQATAPPSGDWTGFMRRLDGVLNVTSPARRRPSRLSGALRLAAMLAIAVVGVWAGFQWQRARRVNDAGMANQSATLPSGSVVPVAPLTSAAGEHLERSKLVLLGLSAMDPEAARPNDWSYERGLASSLLADTTQYRLVAAGQGRLDLASVLGDLETVLLQVSLGDDSDPRALERLQRMINRRDLLTKIEVMKTEGPVDRSLPVGSSGRGYEGRSRGND